MSKYTFEEKLEAVLRVLNEGMSKAESAHILGVSKGDCNREPEKRIEEERRSVREALAAAKQTKRNVRVKAVGGNQAEQLFR